MRFLFQARRSERGTAGALPLASRRRPFRWLATVAAFLVGLRCLALTPPHISVHAVLVDETRHEVLIHYSLADADADACEVSATVSVDGGLTFQPSPADVAGDVGYPVAPGTSKVIVWTYDPAEVDLSATSSQDVVLRLVADDLTPLPIDDLVNAVDPARLQADLNTIAGVRHATANPTHLQATREFIEERFTAAGLRLRRQSFGSGVNLIGRLPGAQDEQRTYILDAHYDTVDDSPGADDNGSGVAGLLEAMRILAPYVPQRSLEFIAFDREEGGLQGSAAYVQQGRLPNVEIAGVINLEMIGYYSSAPNSQDLPPGFQNVFPALYANVAADQFRGNFISLMTNASSSALSTTVQQAAAARVPGLRLLVAPVPAQLEDMSEFHRSDHASFWSAGIPACMLSDTAESRNPHYHTSGDTVATLNFPFMANVVRAVVAGLVELADVRHATSTSLPITLAAGSAPVIVGLDDQLVPPNGFTGPISFVIDDADTAAGSLQLFARSSNPALIPAEGITFAGSGSQRSVTITPAANRTGTAEITITVGDSALSSSTTFTINVTGPLAPATLDRTNATSNGFTLEWAAVPEALGYRIDVATDPAFSHFVSGYENLDVGNATSRSIPGLAAGSYHVRVRAYNASGSSIASEPLLVGVGGRVLNLSARARTADGAGVLIAGFVVRGSGSKPLLIRAAGPSLSALHGLAGVPDPRLALFDNADPPKLIPPGNDDWDGSDSTLLTAISTVGAFPFPSGSKDAAMVLNLPQGVYSVHAQPSPQSPGIALLELYELDENAELMNISARAFVGTGNDVLIPGTYLGKAARRVMVRAVGETLGTLHGVPGVLVDPLIEVHQVDGAANPLFTNDDWSEAPNAGQIAATAADLLAFPLPSGSKDAVVLADLPVGGYTFVISGKGSTGIVLFELYVVP